MPPAARYLWHQRLAWLLMVYATAVGYGISPEFVAGRPNISVCLGWLMQCSIIMVCVKDSALMGRPMPYSWRLLMLCMLPIAVFLVEWRARRWWGLVWIALHVAILGAALVVAQMAYLILTAVLNR